MSTSKGNHTRKRPQKHQNKTVFKNDLHDTSHKTKFINSLEVTGVCKRCKDIIEWKIKYKKYKPLTGPRKCVNCEQKKVKYAYHMFCTQCATEKQVCTKCCKPMEIQDTSPDIEHNESEDLNTLIKGLPERKRRTILRYIKKQQDGEQKLAPEIKTNIEELLSKMNSVNLDDDLCDFSDEDYETSEDDLD